MKKEPKSVNDGTYKKLFPVDERLASETKNQLKEKKWILYLLQKNLATVAESNQDFGSTLIKILLRMKKMEKAINRLFNQLSRHVHTGIAQAPCTLKYLNDANASAREESQLPPVTSLHEDLDAAIEESSNLLSYIDPDRLRAVQDIVYPPANACSSSTGDTNAVSAESFESAIRNINLEADNDE